MTAESDLQARIRLVVGRVPHARLFRNTVGEAWAGKLVSGPDNGVVLLARARRITFGLAPGSSDLIGWTSLTITPDMVGQNIAVFTSGEVKAGTRKPRFQGGQENWLAAVAAAGGLAAVLRSEDDARRLVRAA